MKTDEPSDSKGGSFFIKTKFMKQLTAFAFCLLTISFLSSCDEENADNTFELGDLFTLNFGESLQLANDDLTVTFTEVLEDSRCPQGAQCIWEGQARIQLTLNDDQTVELIDHTGEGPEARDTVDNYVFTLLDVQPYPVEGDTIAKEEYKIELQVDSL